MPDARIDITAAAAFFGVAFSPEKVQRAAQRGLYSAGLKLKSIIITQEIPACSPKPVDRGHYRGGWRVRKGSDGNGVYVVIENNVPHAKFIEYGVQRQNVRIGRAMIDALTEWVRRKKFVGIAKDSKHVGQFSKERKGVRRFKGTDTQARSFAWAIANKMKKRGVFNQGEGFSILGNVMKHHSGTVVEKEVFLELKALFSKKR